MCVGNEEVDASFQLTRYENDGTNFRHHQSYLVHKLNAREGSQLVKVKVTLLSDARSLQVLKMMNRGILTLTFAGMLDSDSFCCSPPELLAHSHVSDVLPVRAGCECKT